MFNKAWTSVYIGHALVLNECPRAKREKKQFIMLLRPEQTCPELPLIQWSVNKVKSFSVILK